MQQIENLDQLELHLDFNLSRYYPELMHSHPGIRLSQVAQNLIKAIEKADPLAIEDGCALIALDPHLPFGKSIKNNIARALRRVTDYCLSSDRNRVVRTTANLLSLEFCPRETEDYCKLVRKFGKAEVIAVQKLATPRDKKSKALISNLDTNCE